MEAEATYIYRVKARNGDNLSAQSNFFNAHLPAPPPEVTINFGQATYSVEEGQSIDITVTLDVDPRRTVEVPISASNQGNTLDEDYSGVPVSVTFNSGDTEQTFSISATDDAQDDPGKSFTLSLGTLPDRTTAGATATTTVSITDNDDSPQGPLDLIGNMTMDFSGKATAYTGSKLAIRFTTGSSAHGWELTAVKLHIASWDSGVTPTVTLHQAGTGNEPGEHITTITNPRKGKGKRVFPAPTGTILEPETTYAVVLGSDGADADNTVAFRTTDKDQDDSVSARGWSLADHSLRLASGNWTADSAAIKVAVVGTALQAPRAVNTAPTGTPVITGTAEVGSTLSADTSAIADADGLTNADYTYQWTRNDGSTYTDISGATASTYTLTPNDQGKTLTVKVVFTDDAGHQESLTSSPTPVITLPTPDTSLQATETVTTLPTIDVSPCGSNRLHVSWQPFPNDQNATGYRIEWKSGQQSYDGSETSIRKAEIPATGTLEYTITGLDNGTEYSVKVTAFNSQGNGTASAESMATPQAPNFIVIFLDDLGYNDASFLGTTDITTTNMDLLAENGVTFTNAYAPFPTCGPSRAGLLTGRYPSRFGIEGNIAYNPFDQHMGLPLEETLIPEYLQEAGYETGIVGKWHLGAATKFTPLQRGFDYFYGFLPGEHDYWKVDMTAYPMDDSTGYYSPIIENTSPVILDDYLTTAFTDKAIEFIEKDRDRPFFLYLPYNAPHRPFQAPEDTVQRYLHISDETRRNYLAMVHELDFDLGRIVQSLEDSGQLDSTAVLFTSDNGGDVRGDAPMDNGNLKGGKRQFDEGGIRVPLVASWPRRWPKDATFQHMVINMDISATIMDLAGATATDTHRPLDGVNIHPHVTGAIDTPPHDALFWRHSRSSPWDKTMAVRAGDMKLIKTADDDPKLYNLSTDIGETTDILHSNLETADRLAKLWNNWNTGNLPSSVTYRINDYENAVEQFFRTKFQKRQQAAESAPPMTFEVPHIPPAVAISFATGAYTVTEGGTTTITVELDADPERSFEVPVTVSNQGGTQDDDYSGVPANVTFNSGETQQTFDFTATDDADHTPAKSVVLGFGPLPDRVTAGTTANTTVSINENDEPPPVPAELVSNMAGSFSDDAITHANRRRAFSFTTGDAGTGWLLTAIRLQIASWPSGRTPSVTLHQEGTSEGPGDLIATMTSPEAGMGKREFSAPKNTILQPDTTYTVVVGSDGASTSEAVRFRTTMSDQNDDGAAEGWSLADDSLQFFYQAWTSLAAVPKAAIVGLPLAAETTNTPATGVPVVTGTPLVGQVLTSDTSTIADSDGLANVSYAYQWVRGDGNTSTDITGATGETYTLAPSDEGSTIRVRVSFTDDAGNPEELISADTQPVATGGENSPIWQATMTAAPLYVGNGYSDFDGFQNGSLTAKAFSTGGVTYTANVVEASGWIYIGFDQEMPMAFILEIDGVRLESTDATLTSYSYTNTYLWEKAETIWSDGQQVELRLYVSGGDEG